MEYKFQTYLGYFSENLRFLDFTSIKDSINYVLFKKVPKSDRVITTRMGKFFTRKKTTDFMFTNYAYELKVKQFIKKYALHFDHFVDIGACIGDYSIWMANEGMKVTAIEPDPENYAMLRENIRLNMQFNKIKTFNIGLSDEEGILPFASNPSNRGASKVVDPNSQEESIKIPVEKWDSILAATEIKPKDQVLMKLDVEGMEERVIKGMMQFLKNRQNVILILEAKLSDVENLKNLINSSGKYRYFNIDEHNIGAIKIG